MAKKISNAAAKALASVDWAEIDAMTDADIARQIEKNPDAVDLGSVPPEALRVVHPPGGISVRGIRAKLGLSQSEFAARFGFSVGAVRDWEQNRKTPEGPTRTLLLLIEENPELVAAAVARAA